MLSGMRKPLISPLLRLRHELVPTLSQREVSRRTKIDAGTIGDLEAGRTEILFRHAEALAPVYGKSAPDLMKAMAEWYVARRPKPRKRPARPSSPVVSPPEAA